MSSKSNPPQKPGVSSNAARTAERRKERERERRRNRMIVVIVVIVVVALLSATALILANQPSDAPVPPEALARYTDLAHGQSAEGYPRIGNPTSPVQVALYSSFDCSACLILHDEIMDDLAQRVRDNQISLTFVPLYGFGSLTNGEGAARAAMCAQAQGGFWPYQDALFAWQAAYGNQAFTQSRLTSGIEALGLDRGAFELCSRTGVPDTVLTEARADASALLNFKGTPALTVNGVIPVDETGVPVTGAPALLAALDRSIQAAALRNVRPTTQPAQEATAEVTAEATLEPTRVRPTQSPTLEVTAEATVGS
ncbi:MAG: thioredoxin domain-containing protein [Anaerolineae bacterium]